MEWALQNFGYISHSITTCGMEQMKSKTMKRLSWNKQIILVTQVIGSFFSHLKHKMRQHWKIQEVSRHLQNQSKAEVGKPLPLLGMSFEKHISSHVIGKYHRWWSLHEASQLTWTETGRDLTQHLRHHTERWEYSCEDFVSDSSQTLNRWFQFIDNFCVR